MRGILGLALALSLAVVPAPAAAALPTEDASRAIGPSCVERVAIPTLDNVFDIEWSPDGWRLAVVRYVRVASGEHAGGYLELEVLETLDLRTGQVRFFGEGTRPAWSASGRYMSYWGFEADYLKVDDGEKTLADLTPTNPEYRWSGDSLVYFERSTIREWSVDELRTVRKIDFADIPHHPADQVHWSGDGSRYTVTRYDAERPEPERFVAYTEAGSLEAVSFPGAMHTEWRPSGAQLLVRYPTRLEIRDEAGAPETTIPIAAGAMHQWGPDGKTLLVRGPATAAGGDAFEEVQVVWPSAGTLTLPNLLGPRSFSPDGRFYSGTVRTGRHQSRLEVYRCVLLPRGEREPVPDLAARAARLDEGTGRLVRPVQGPISQFMERGHTGIDVAAAFGSEVVAADDGVVRAAGWIANGGYRVCVGHAAGLETCYFHTAGPLVRAGERVRRGQPIALVGMSGLTRGPHVHWEARFLGRIVDPLLR